MCKYEFLRLGHSDQVWLDFWDIVAKRILSLQDLRMTIGFTVRPFAIADLSQLFGKDRGLLRDINAPWVKPIHGIRGLKRFELEILEEVIYDKTISSIFRT